jgi:hypothetical protein
MRFDVRGIRAPLTCLRGRCQNRGRVKPVAPQDKGHHRVIMGFHRVRLIAGVKAGVTGAQDLGRFALTHKFGLARDYKI